MNRTTVFLSFVLLTFLLTPSADAQRKKRPMQKRPVQTSPPKQKETQPQRSVEPPAVKENVTPIPRPINQDVPPVEERNKLWLGQKVILLNPVQGRARGFHRYGQPKEDALAKEYVGKTGSITEVVEEKGDYGMEKSLSSSSMAQGRKL